MQQIPCCASRLVLPGIWAAVLERAKLPVENRLEALLTGDPGWATPVLVPAR